MGKIPFGIRHLKGGGPAVLFIMGYGNDFNNPGVRWLIDRIRRSDLNCKLVRIPTRFDSFREDIIERCEDLEKSMGGHTLISHSFGGLAGAYLTGSRRRIFLSPYWGVPPGRRNPISEWIVKSMGGSKIPLIPRGFGKRDLGDLARKGDIDPVPRFLTFRSVNQIIDLCDNLPPARKGDVAYISEDDRIIDLGAVKGRGIEVRYFKGGHQPFVVSDRGRIFGEIRENVI